LRHDVLVWPIDEEGKGVGINRWSDIEERKRNESDAKAGDELPPTRRATPPPVCGPPKGPKKTRRSVKSSRSSRNVNPSAEGSFY
jgi:hypothetical protein